MWSLDFGLILVLVVVSSALVMVVVVFDGKAKPKARLSVGA